MQIAIKSMRGFVRVQLKLPLNGEFFLCDTGSSYALIMLFRGGNVTPAPQNPP